MPDRGGKPGPDRIHHPIQFFDVLFALQVMADLGRLGEPRCSDALGLRCPCSARLRSRLPTPGRDHGRGGEVEAAGTHVAQVLLDLGVGG